MSKHEELKAAVGVAKNNLTRAINALGDFESTPEFHTYETYSLAISEIEDILCGNAKEACEGSHCHGLAEYTQEFIVKGEHYIGKLECEYNRHDKRYYYLEYSNFTVEKL